MTPQSGGDGVDADGAFGGGARSGDGGSAAALAEVAPALSPPLPLYPRHPRPCPGWQPLASGLWVMEGLREWLARRVWRERSGAGVRGEGSSSAPGEMCRGGGGGC